MTYSVSAPGFRQSLVQCLHCLRYIGKLVLLGNDFFYGPSYLTVTCSVLLPECSVSRIYLGIDFQILFPYLALLVRQWIHALVSTRGFVGEFHTFFYVKVYPALEVDSVLLSSCHGEVSVSTGRNMSCVDSRPSLLKWRSVRSRCFRCILCPTWLLPVMGAFTMVLPLPAPSVCSRTSVCAGLRAIPSLFCGRFFCSSEGLAPCIWQSLVPCFFSLFA